MCRIVISTLDEISLENIRCVQVATAEQRRRVEDVL